MSRLTCSASVVDMKASVAKAPHTATPAYGIIPKFFRFPSQTREHHRGACPHLLIKKRKREDMNMSEMAAETADKTNNAAKM